MQPDDPRHGSFAGYSAHRRHGEKPCDPCRLAFNRYRRYWEHFRLFKVPVRGSQRRVRALLRIGWSHQAIADHADLGLATVSRIARAERPTIRHRVAAQIAATYEALSGTPGPSSLAAQRAARKGYAPPLAWDDIDHDETPRGIRRAA